MRTPRWWDLRGPLYTPTRRFFRFEVLIVMIGLKVADTRQLSVGKHFELLTHRNIKWVRKSA